MRNDVTGDWRRLPSEELHNLYSSPNIVRMVKSRMMRRNGHVARIRAVSNAYKILFEKLTSSIIRAIASETSVNFCETKRCRIPEDNDLHTRRPESLKCHISPSLRDLNNRFLKLLLTAATQLHKDCCILLY
jgi:hypothetical protein